MNNYGRKKYKRWSRRKREDRKTNGLYVELLGTIAGTEAKRLVLPTSHVQNERKREKN